ncbi:hypothetical protein LJR289_002246 [Pseudoduganella sp. LjRoot289]|uniref:STY0301 family protein n=1 Tax=Pseudoduganella sp. LjRoot289 TaxID=3342314 RepID=UPI003ECCA0CF
MPTLLKTQALLLAAGIAAAHAHAETVLCPAAILATSTAASSSDWEAVPGTGQHKLENARLYSGHPSEEVPLAPDESPKGKPLVARWRLELDPKHEYWVACTYRGTPVVLAKQLDRKLSQCLIQYRRAAGPPPGRIQEINCS